MALWPTAKGDLSGTLFVGNSTTGLAKGGAIISHGALNVTNCTFSGNHADTHGGAISVEGGTTTVTHATIAGNTTLGMGAGFYVGGTLNLRNTVVAGNTPGGNCAVSGGVITDGTGNLRHPDTDPSCVGTYGDPLLLPLADNGGPTRTMAILPGSAALDRIDSPGGCGFGLTTDQRGISRPQPVDGACDIGAYEFLWPGPGNTSSTVCFIATAAWGSSQEAHVDTLRRFRDVFLVTNAPGRAFVTWYYRHSPPWAAAIAQDDALRQAARITLFPVYCLAAAALNGTPWMFFLAATPLLGWFLWSRRRGRRGSVHP